MPEICRRVFCLHSSPYMCVFSFTTAAPAPQRDVVSALSWTMTLAVKLNLETNFVTFDPRQLSEATWVWNRSFCLWSQYIQSPRWMEFSSCNYFETLQHNGSNVWKVHVTSCFGFLSFLMFLYFLMFYCRKKMILLLPWRWDDQCFALTLKREQALMVPEEWT